LIWKCLLCDELYYKFPKNNQPTRIAKKKMTEFWQFIRVIDGTCLSGSQCTHENIKIKNAFPKKKYLWLTSSVVFERDDWCLNNSNIKRSEALLNYITFYRLKLFFWIFSSELSGCLTKVSNIKYLLVFTYKLTYSISD
jgi:hypothetical protein